MAIFLFPSPKKDNNERICFQKMGKQAQLYFQTDGKKAVLGKQSPLTLERKRMRQEETKLEKCAERLQKLQNYEKRIKATFQQKWLPLRLIRALTLPEAAYSLLKSIPLEFSAKAKAVDSPAYWRYKVDCTVGVWSFFGYATYEMSSIHITKNSQPYEHLNFDNLTRYNGPAWYKTWCEFTEHGETAFRAAVDIMEHSTMVEEHWFDLQTSGMDLSAVVFAQMLESLRYATDGEGEISREPWDLINLLM